MKKQLLLFSVALLIASSSLAQWNPLPHVSQYYPAWDLKSHNSQLFVTTNVGVYSSTDDGNTWADLTNGFASSSSSSDREIVFTSNNEIFVRTTTYGILRSLNNGVTWTIDTAGIGSSGSSNEAKTIFYDNTNNRVFTSAGWPSYGLFYKSPADNNWTRVSSGSIGTNSGTLIHYMVAKGSKLFAAGYNTFFESSDGGITWTQKTVAGYPANTSSAFTTAPLLAIGNDLYMGSTGVYKSTDDGSTWTRIDNNFSLFYGAPYVTAMHYDGTKLYAAVRSNNAPNYLYVTSDLGTNWSDMGTAGTYFVSVTTHNNKVFGSAFGHDSVFVYNSGTIGIVEPNSTKLTISPNPVSEYLNVSCSWNGNTVIEIYDMQGKKVMSRNSIMQKKSPSKLNFSGIAPGEYLILLRNDQNEIQTQKIVVE